MANQKEFTVEIELEIVEFRIKAKNKTEARKKALAKLKRKNPVSLIYKDFSTGRKRIGIDEI